MSESDKFQKHELECMRLAADCMQLVSDVHSPALQSHFLRMAKVWSILADRRPNAGTQAERSTQTKNRTKRAHPARERI